QQKRVAVRGRAHDYLDPDIGAGAGPVLNDEGLSQPLRQPLTYQARKDVEGSAGRDRHDDTHRPVGIDLRNCNSRDHWQRGRARGQMQKLPSVGKFHSITPSAMAESPGGISRPSALAALRLITNSNLVDCSTGRSLALAPFKIRPT